MFLVIPCSPPLSAAARDSGALYCTVGQYRGQGVGSALWGSMGVGGGVWEAMATLSTHCNMDGDMTVKCPFSW